MKVGLASLTERELEVLKLVASLKPMNVIAIELKISKSTLSEHKERVMIKLDLPRDGRALAHLVTFCFRNKLIK